MTEAEITKKSIKALRARGHAAFKIVGGPMQASGLSDITACICGHFVAIEMKKPGKEGNLTEKQAKKLRDIKKAGGVTRVCTSVEQVVELAERIENKYAR